jgi:simple sugar transport system permease protein
MREPVTARARRLGAGRLPWRLERRALPGPVAPYRVGAIVFGIALALLFGPLVTGVDAAAFYDTVWTATFRSPAGFSNVLILATPLLLTALAACVPYRLRLWNIGADGQMFLGAWVAAALAFTLSPHVSGPVLMLIVLVGSAIGGLVLILLPALARAYLGVNELVTTLMLNFAGLYWLIYWATGPWRDPVSAGGVQSKELPEAAQLPTLTFGLVGVPIGFFGAIVAAALLWAYFRWSRFGYELRIMRESEGAAAYAGIRVRRRVVGVLLIGGALGGLAGAVEMLGNTYHYGDALSNNIGYTGIVVAILAAGSELAVVPIAVLFASVLAGGSALSTAGVQSNLVVTVLGLTVLIAAVGDGLARFRLVRRAPATVEEPVPLVEARA